MAKRFSVEVTFQLGEACNLACFPSGTIVSTPFGGIDISNVSPEDTRCGVEETTTEKIISNVGSVSK